MRTKRLNYVRNNTRMARQNHCGTTKGEVTGRVATISRPFHYYNTHTNDANMKMDETEIRNEFDKNLDSHLASDANDVDMAAGKKNNHYINNNRQHSGANPSAANK
eukprot:98727_1